MRIPKKRYKISWDKNSKSNIGYNSVMFTVLDRENQRMKTCGEKVIRSSDPIVASFIYHRDLAYVLENVNKIEEETVWNYPTVPYRNREQAETTISSDKKGS